MDRTIRVNMFSTAAVLALGIVVSFVTSTLVVSRGWTKSIAFASRIRFMMKRYRSCRKRCGVNW